MYLISPTIRTITQMIAPTARSARADRINHPTHFSFDTGYAPNRLATVFTSVGAGASTTVSPAPVSTGAAATWASATGAAFASSVSLVATTALATSGFTSTAGAALASPSEAGLISADTSAET